MGAIILGNLVARVGSECAMDAAIAISGGLDMRQQINYYRAQRLWQPMLATELRDTFVLGKWGERVRYRLTKNQMKQLMRATHITEIDETAVVAYNGFRDVVHYYSEMSVLGDIPYHPNEYNRESIPPTKRVSVNLYHILIRMDFAAIPHTLSFCFDSQTQYLDSILRNSCAGRPTDILANSCGK